LADEHAGDDAGLQFGGRALLHAFLVAGFALASACRAGVLLQDNGLEGGQGHSGNARLHRGVGRAVALEHDDFVFFADRDVGCVAVGGEDDITAAGSGMRCTTSRVCGSMRLISMPPR